MSDFDEEFSDLNSQLEPLLDSATIENPPSDSTEGEPASENQQTEEKAEKPSPVGPEKSHKFASYLEWLGVLIACVVILAAGFINIILLPTAALIVSLGLIVYALWKGRQTNNVYTFILACALAAIILAIYCLWIELDRYNYNIRVPDSLKRSVSMDCSTARSLSNLV